MVEGFPRVTASLHLSVQDFSEDLYRKAYLELLSRARINWFHTPPLSRRSHYSSNTREKNVISPQNEMGEIVAGVGRETSVRCYSAACSGFA